MNLDFATVLNLWPALARGAAMTLLLTLAVLLVATPPAMLLAMARDSRRAVLRRPVAMASWIVRGIPPILLLLIVFFVPADFGVNLPPFAAALAGLSLYMAFTFAEVFRAGLRSIDRGQHHAVAALGLPPLRSFRRLLLPQMLPAVLPPYVSHVSSLLKNTSLATVVAIRELTAVGKSLLAATYRPLETLFVVGLIYAAFSAALFVLQARLERRWPKR
jgi:His/Glu/Gln/Arg/opine family amino acid ABC transporter permease subunit